MVIQVIRSPLCLLIFFTHKSASRQGGWRNQIRLNTRKTADSSNVGQSLGVRWLDSALEQPAA
ncbi:MAG: hypothetical protein DMG05_14270 [Acidobacteria bacterium]|nr:MAG: hypothetical protein DMG05_14270 [Acidobacteriota bacterium]